DSTAGLSALLGLFLNEITARQGAGTEDRVSEMRALSAHFEPYSYHPGSKARPILSEEAEEDTP
ncbi:MAG: hypothetical protein AAF681_04420, partial [Pseudomonadota bacterium]